jgi:hypothetical protein
VQVVNYISTIVNVGLLYTYQRQNFFSVYLQDKEDIDNEQIV